MKRVFKIILALVVLLAILRFFFPPLAELGYTEPTPDVRLQVMVDKKGGLNPVQIYVEAPETLPITEISDDLCAAIVADMAAGAFTLIGLSNSGVIDFNFVRGGRYFYRFNDKETVTYAYTADGCQQSDGA